MIKELTSLAILSVLIAGGPLLSYGQETASPYDRARLHHEAPDQPFLSPAPFQETMPGYRLKSTGFFTEQVNVDANGNNIIGDAANEPSIAVDPKDPNHIVIGWRQFDNVNSNFRQAGYGYTADGGLTWTFPGVLEPGVFRSDPVLDFDTAGNFYYNSLTANEFDEFSCKVFRSFNGGAAWDTGTYAWGGDKQWMAIDRTAGAGSGNIYSSWTAYYSSCYPGSFTRSTDKGDSFYPCIPVDGFPYWGTMAVGPSGELYIASGGPGDGFSLVRSSDAQFPDSAGAWDLLTYVDVDGYVVGQDPINPLGIMGQVNVEVDVSNGPGHGNVYMLASVARLSVDDPADVMFAKSIDGGQTFGPAQRLNTDSGIANRQWFGTMSVAPNGRIDVAWLDTRDDTASNFKYKSALYYCYSDDQGETWSINKKLSELFDPTVGYPQQNKMGDYFDMVSDDAGAHLAWANTLNGEEDVYYTHILPSIVGMEEQSDVQDQLRLSVFPNPFREQAVIRYSIPSGCRVRVDVINLYGEVALTVAGKEQPAGSYTVDLSAGILPAGYYLCRLSAGTRARTISMVKLK